MSYLSTELKRLMEERKWKAVDLNRRQPALLNSFLSRIIRGDQKYISPQDLKRLSLCFAKSVDDKPTPEDSAAIIAAHCMDEREGPGSDLVIIKIKRNGKQKEVGKVSPRVERALTFIRAAVNTDAKMESLIENLAHLLGMQSKNS